MVEAKKSLGQHWLKDAKALEMIAELADISHRETVLEVGPGPGGLTRQLLKRGARVVAVEKDETLAGRLQQGSALEVITGDILKFDLGELPPDYKVVANIPYYLTSHLLRLLSEATNPPKLMVLLVQKEVAERICARPGQMSLLSVSVQLNYDCALGPLVPAEYFTPPPKVDSQVVILRRRPKPLFDKLDSRIFFSLARAGFGERRKKLRSSLAGGLGLSVRQAEQLLSSAEIDPNLRAQALSLNQWHRLYVAYSLGKNLRGLL